MGGGGVLAVLAGGVGAARLLQGLVELVPEGELTIIVNTGDDIELHGLHVSPDLDIITYTLAGLVDEEKGWGFKGDTFNCLEALGRYGAETWFKLGDKDLATHIYRTKLLREGFTLSEATERIRKALGVKARILPMTNDRVETRIETDEGSLHFQEYLVKLGARPRVLGVKFEGAKRAKPAPGALEAVLEAEGVIVAPSNPVVSIGPILAVEGFKRALRKVKEKVVAVTPIVQGAPLKGPADKLMRGLGLEVSARAVAKLYGDFLGHFVLDWRDEALKGDIEALGIRVAVTETIMKNLRDKVKLAKEVLRALGL